MKKYVSEFVHRGLLAAAGGPVVLAVIYGILGRTGVAESFSSGQVSMGILTVTLMAFIAAGITTVYTVDRLPLISAALIHGGVLYLDYLLMYLLNSWIPRDPGAIGIFTGIFLAGYVAVWLAVYLTTRAKTQRLNRKLRKG